MAKNTAVVRIPTSIDGDFFRYYLEFLSPIHKLTARETDVLAAFLKERYRLSKLIPDDAIVSQLMMSEDTKRVLKDKCEMSSSHFQVIFSKLRKLGYIKNGTVDQRFVPDIDSSTDKFNLIFFFDLNV